MQSDASKNGVKQTGSDTKLETGPEVQRGTAMATIVDLKDTEQDTNLEAGPEEQHNVAMDDIQGAGQEPGLKTGSKVLFELETEPKVVVDAAMEERNGPEDKKVATSSD